MQSQSAVKPRKPRQAAARHSGHTIKGSPHKLVKATHTARRYELRETLWKAVSRAARKYIEEGGTGTARLLAQTLGVSDSQIHRFTCPVCEHDQEPTFSIAMGILLHLGARKAAKVVDLTDDQISIVTIHKDKQTY